MSQTIKKKQYYSKEEYLESEKQADYKSEYYKGEIFAMSGETANHSIITVNLTWAIRGATADKDCVTFESNMKLEIDEGVAYVYPDLTVVCGKVQGSKNTDHAITNPVLIIEVLSPSTEMFDRGGKFEYYRKIPSLKEYVLVSQDKPMIEVYFKQNETSWLYSVVKGLDKKITLNSLNCEIALKDIYHKTELIDGR